MLQPRMCKVVLLTGGLFFVNPAALCVAQESQPAKTAEKESQKPLPFAEPGDQVVIRREAVALIDPQKYRTPLYLSPQRSVTLVAPYDSIVRVLPVKPGQSLQAQSEVVRLDNTIQKLLLQRAQSLYKAATLEQKSNAGNSNDDQKELWQAKVDAAKADLDLAQYQMDLSTIRMPFNGEAIRLLVDEGQFVKAGDAVALVGDTTLLKVEIPAERSAVEQAASLTLKIEGQDVEAKIQSVLPLDPKFDPLRELFDSITSAVLVVDNSKRRYQPGQSVYVPLIPRHPVAEVPNSAVLNDALGGRKVQVLREQAVRDVSVVLMGSVGADRLYVSGPFSSGDEVIIEKSLQLSDGFPVKPSAPKANKTDGSGTGNPVKPAADF